MSSFSKNKGALIKVLWHKLSFIKTVFQYSKTEQKNIINPFAPGDFAEKRILKLVKWFSGHCRAIKS